MSRRVGDPAAVVARLRAAGSALVTTHAAPDGDAVGSELALAGLLERLGARVVVANRDPHPANLAFLPGVERLTRADDLPADLSSAFDLAVVVDCPGLDRPKIPGLDRLPLVEIDHHLENALFGEPCLVDEAAAATGELILELWDAAGLEPDPASAVALYVAIVTDTGDFRYANTTPRTLRAAARLVDGGVRPAEIARALWEQVPERVVRLTGAVLSTLSFAAGGRAAVLHCDAAMLAATGARREDTEDLVNHARAIAGVQVAVFLKAFTPDAVRISLRSRGAVDVQAIARGFGGGGHREAAGCTVPGSLDEARRAVVNAVAAALEQT